MSTLSNARLFQSLRYRQTLTVLLLFGGYAALYFCRADLSVATPLLRTSSLLTA